MLAEAAAILLLGVLVAGLLRSHAEILRRLHELGAGADPDHSPGPVDVPFGCSRVSRPRAPRRRRRATWPG